jgi:hypothetical protein
MTTGNTTLLGLALPVNGELTGTWGTTVNDSLTSLVDSAVAGTTTLSADADVTLTDTVLTANQARQAVLLWTASNGASTRNVTAPARSKPYIVINAGTGSIVLRGAGPTTGITVVAGERCVAAWNGSDFVKVSSSVATALTGTLPVANGGTGATTLTSNNVILGNGTSAVQTVAPGTTGNVLTSNGTTWTSSAIASSQWTTSGSDIYYNTGNVGIGTSSPSRKLMVVGTAAVSSDFYVGYDNANANIIAKSSVANGGAGASQFLFGNASTDTRGYLTYTHSNDSLLIGTTGTTKATIDGSGNLLVGIASAVSGGGVLQVSNGITFPATQSASSNANTLDDYEEGTFTPALAGGYTGITYLAQDGWYRKVGSVVVVSARILFSGTADGNPIGIGCPFTQGPTGYGGGGIPYSSVAVITNTSPYITTNSSTVLFYTLGTGVDIVSSGNVSSQWISYVITMSV